MQRFLAASLIVFACSLHGEDWVNRAPRVGADVFPIMAWSGSPTDAESLRLMKEAGLNVTGFCKVEELE